MELIGKTVTKEEIAEINGKKIYYCIAGFRVLAIPSVNIIKHEDGEIEADEVYGVDIRPHPMAPNMISVSLTSVKNIRIRWNVLFELTEGDPIYEACIQQMSGIVRPH